MKASPQKERIPGSIPGLATLDLIRVPEPSAALVQYSAAKRCELLGKPVDVLPVLGCGQVVAELVEDPFLTWEMAPTEQEALSALKRRLSRRVRFVVADVLDGGRE